MASCLTDPAGGKLAEASPVRATVVVTHHLPHPRSVAPQFAGIRIRQRSARPVGARRDRRCPALGPWPYLHELRLSGGQRPGSSAIRRAMDRWRPGGRIENPSFNPRLVVEIWTGSCRTPKAIMNGRHGDIPCRSGGHSNGCYCRSRHSAGPSSASQVGRKGADSRPAALRR